MKLHWTPLFCTKKTKKTCGKIGHLEYCLALIESILNRYLDSSRKVKRSRLSDVLDPLSQGAALSCLHPAMPKQRQPENASFAVKSKEKMGKGWEKKLFWCSSCKKPLCVIACFEITIQSWSFPSETAKGSACSSKEWWGVSECFVYVICIY